MSLPIISADARLAEPRGIKGCIFGKSGIGKTTLLWTLVAQSTLFMDLEAGDLAIEGWQGDSIRQRTWTECRDFAVFIGGPNPALRDDQPYSAAHYEAVCAKFGDPSALERYDTIFVDSITVAGRLCFGWYKGQPEAVSEKTGKPDIRGAYGLHGREMIGCGAIGFDRSTFHYNSRRADQAAVEKRIKEICETRVRYGYRRVHVLLDREGWGIKIKKVYRIYRELGMQLRNKTPKRRVKAKLRDDRAEAVGPNDVWAMDFVHDQLATGKKLRVLTVVDTFSRYVPVLDARFSYRGEDVVTTLDRTCRMIGYPKTIRVDQGSEFISRDMDLWAYQRGVTLDFSRPGKPTDNAFIEAFNGRFRAECLNAHWFLTLADAAEKLETWRRYYNTVRPHSALGYRPPAPKSIVPIDQRPTMH